MARVAGILMPITSLSSPYGIGTIGKEARQFADFLKASGQKIWQILPVGPTSYGDSPYQSFSTYAGNPYMIDLDTLVEQELLDKATLDSYDWGSDSGRVDYEKIYNNRFEVLKIAYKNFKENKDQKAFNSFKRKNAAWVKDYALYMAVKNSFDCQGWTQWPDESIKLREEAAVKKYERKYREEVDFWKWLQFEFYTQWEDFRAYVNSLGIQIVGDMPIYVAMDSADTWANPEVFWLDENREPVCVAGCPPDFFAETGQLWGNPIYDWDYLKETGYDWWIRRVEAAAKLFDITRIDHFRAFDTYYAIPYPAENAIGGEWKIGPRMDFFNKMRERLGDVPIIAEDLGELFDSVTELLNESGYPGMKILTFGFGDGWDNDFLPHRYTSNCVVYTGTHDNDTVNGWLATATQQEIDFAKQYCGISDGDNFCWKLIEKCYECVADYCVIPLQDILELGSEGRMNIPSTLGGNWEWRVDPSMLTKEVSDRLYNLAQTYSRLEEN